MTTFLKVADKVAKPLALGYAIIAIITFAFIAIKCLIEGPEFTKEVFDKTKVCLKKVYHIG